MKMNDEWKKQLYTPTQINRCGKYYYIVDCWNHRILYSRFLKTPLGLWRTLTENILGGHTVASDGKVLLADDTDNDLIRVYRDNREIQQVDVSKYTPESVCHFYGNSLLRPHFVLYIPALERFFVAVSWGGYFLEAANTGSEIEVTGCYCFPEIRGRYIKFLEWMDGALFCSANNSIVRMEIKDSGVSVGQVWDTDLGGDVNYLTIIHGMYYLTFWKNGGIRRAVTIDALCCGKSEEISNEFPKLKGIPYYISRNTDRYFLTVINDQQAIYSFSVGPGNIIRAEVLFDYGEPTEANLLRKRLDPIL